MDANAVTGYRTDPGRRTIQGVDVSARVQRSPGSASRWDVLVVIARAPDLEQLEGGDLEADLLDRSGKPLPVLASPSGPLVETGGSLGFSAHAQFQFQDLGEPLGRLVIRFGGEKAAFALSPEPPGAP